MTGQVDNLMTRALRGTAPWREGIDSEVVAARAIYHGIAGILIDHSVRIADWPIDVLDRLRQQAMAQNMWEMRHKLVVTDLLDRVAAGGISVRLLKGTAFAYGIYPRPGQRPRGDSDILIAPRDLSRARSVLSDAGFSPCLEIRTTSTVDRLQEVWTMRHPDGSIHEIDLHWAALNSPLLATILPVELAMDGPACLPSLGRNALTLPGELALMHAAMHRAKHVLSPYFVDGVVYYGGERLIWLVDIDLLWRALHPEDRNNAVTWAVKMGVGGLVGAALGAARDHLATSVDKSVLAALNAAPAGAAARYLASDTRAAQEMRDVSASGPVMGKMRYLRTRLFPPRQFIRAKYPRLSRWPLAFLYLKRFVLFWRPRRGQDW